MKINTPIMEDHKKQKEPSFGLADAGAKGENDRPQHQAEKTDRSVPPKAASKDEAAEPHGPDEPAVASGDLSTLVPKIKYEINLMLLYALHSGKKIPEEADALIHSGIPFGLLKAHGLISEAIAPATPETVMYIDEFYGRKKRFALFSPIPLVRNFTVIAIAAIISIVASSLSSEVNAETLSKGVLNNHGVSLLINLVFLCSASLIGASFFLLSKLTRAVKEATLSPTDTTYYWTMLIMGVLSGMILSEGVSVQTEVLDGSVETNRLIFAILGGFSSEVVYKILQSIMQKVQSAISAI